MIKKIKDWASQGWALGFVRGGMAVIMESEHFEVDWVKMPKDRWFADPFVLDVKDDEILLLVEDYGYEKRKGIISLLHIDRISMEITARKELLELPTHLSFPAIWRKEGHVYVYPESARSGRLDLYEYDAYDQYFYGGDKEDPIVKEAFNLAWLHHIHNNPHHWQHWLLVNDTDGTYALEMPEEYVYEMICDWWSFSFKINKLDEIFSWYEKHRDMVLHKNTRKLVEDLLDKIKKALEE